RHTRCLSDWSSDVCYSDLTEAGAQRSQSDGVEKERRKERKKEAKKEGTKERNSYAEFTEAEALRPRRGRFEMTVMGTGDAWHEQIGRAACRERVSREEGEG